MTIEQEIAEQTKVKIEVDNLLPELFAIPTHEKTLDDYVHLQTGLYRAYEMLFGNALLSDVLNPDGSFSPQPGLPKDLVPAVQPIKLGELSQEELMRNYDERKEILGEMKEWSLRDITWYRQLFRELLAFYEEQISKGVLDTPERHRFQATTGLAWLMLSELLYDVSQAGGKLTYILGVSDNGRVWRKPLPGFNLRDHAYMDRWYRNIFELGGNAVTFYSFDPGQLNRLGIDGWWTHTSHFEDYPAIPNGFQVGSQMLAFGYEHKEYVNSQPHEIINLAGDIDTITVIDESSLEIPRQAAIYKVKHKSGAITAGRVERDASGQFKFWPSDSPVSGWADGVINFSQFDGLYALVGAVVRDMLVAGKEYRYSADFPFKIKEPKHESRADTIIRWIPRFSVVYPGQLGYSPAELEKRVWEVAPSHVSGHVRRVHGTPDPEKVAKALQYRVHIPEGWENWTYVKEFDRGAYQGQHTLWKSRSATQTLFGERVQRAA